MVVSKFALFFWILLILLALAGTQTREAYSATQIFQQMPQNSAVSIETRIVRGTSLEPLIAHGTVVTLAMDPTHQLAIARNDLVVANIARHPEAPVLKIVRGVPGDRFGVAPAEDGMFHLLINGEVVKNSQGLPYRLGGPSARLINAYVHDDNGVMPAATYLLLGDDPSGSLDSTSFGLVGRGGIAGKVIKSGLKRKTVVLKATVL